MRRIKALLGRGEKGQILILVLVALLVGSLTIPPTLSFMDTGILSGQIIETRTAELYAADSGVDTAILWMKNNPGSLPTLLPVELPDSGFTVNGKQVYVTISKYQDPLKPLTYNIVSEAGVGGSVKTTVESYVHMTNTAVDFLNNAITSPGNVTLKPGSEVNGDVQYNGFINNQGTINGDTNTNPIPNWPTDDEMSARYLAQVPVGSPYPSGSIDINVTPTLGPIYRDGNLIIDTTQAGTTLTITDTIYVNGNLTFDQSGSKKAYTVNLNGKTIYVNGAVGVASGNIAFTGTGCIIAKGNINFQPNSSSSDFIFLMSIEGRITLKPGGNFVGAVAGAAEVYLSPGCTLNWEEPPPSLNLPDWSTTGGGGNIVFQVLTYNIVTS